MKGYCTKSGFWLLMLDVFFTCLFAMPAKGPMLEGMTKEEIEAVPLELFYHLRRMDEGMRASFLEGYMGDVKKVGKAYSFSVIGLQGFYLRGSLGSSLLGGVTLVALLITIVASVVCKCVGSESEVGVATMKIRRRLRGFKYLGAKGSGEKAFFVACIAGIVLVVSWIIAWSTLYKEVKRVNRKSFEKRLIEGEVKSVVE